MPAGMRSSMNPPVAGQAGRSSLGGSFEDARCTLGGSREDRWIAARRLGNACWLEAAGVASMQISRKERCKELLQ